VPTRTGVGPTPSCRSRPSPPSGCTRGDLDLRELDPAHIRTAFGRPDFVWVRGGNVFTLRMALAKSGLDRVVVEGLAADPFVYAGLSAGP
jgi:dipeptidase E